MTPRTSTAIAWKNQFLPRRFDSPFSAKHKELQQFVNDAPPGSVSLICAPRAHGKTSFVLAEIMRLALAGQEKYIVLASQDRIRARDMLRNIRGEFEENPRLARKITRKRPWSDYELNFETAKTPRAPEECLREESNNHETSEKVMDKTFFRPYIGFSEL